MTQDHSNNPVPLYTDLSKEFPMGSHVSIFNLNSVPKDIKEIKHSSKVISSVQKEKHRTEASAISDDVESQSAYPTQVIITHPSLNYEQQRIANNICMWLKIANTHSNDVALLRDRTFSIPYVEFYRKGLLHNSDGYVDTSSMDVLISALREHNSAALATIKLGSPHRLINPSAAWSTDIIGSCNNCYRYSAALPLTAMGTAMIKLYAMALARDVPFRAYETHKLIGECCKYLDRVTPSNIFRGSMPADIQGPYISQFLYLDIKRGGIAIPQKYLPYMEGVDYMTYWDSVISTQNGIFEETKRIHSTARYISTGRDLASYIYQEDIVQIFLQSYAILKELQVSHNSDIQTLYNMEEHYINFGSPDIYATLALISRNALLAAWYAQWNSLVLRPEALGIEVERVFRECRNRYGISSELLKNPILEAIRNKYTTVLLPQVYPEGAPLHPSGPSEYGVQAGACATVLKFFFATNFELDVYEPDDTGQQLIKTGCHTSIGEEINKLASNIAMAGVWAGIHYPRDAISGLKLGEKVALSCLHDLIQKYPMKVQITLTKFNNLIHTIHN